MCELENLMEHAVILADGDCIDLPHLISDGHTLDSSFYRFDAGGMLVSDTESACVSARPAAMDVQLEAWAQQVVDACQKGARGSSPRSRKRSWAP